MNTIRSVFNCSALFQTEKELVQNKEEIAILQAFWDKEIPEDYQVTTFAKSLAKKDSLSSFYQHDFYKSYALLLTELEKSHQKSCCYRFTFSQQKINFVLIFQKYT